MKYEDQEPGCEDLQIFEEIYSSMVLNGEHRLKTIEYPRTHQQDEIVNALNWAVYGEIKEPLVKTALMRNSISGDYIYVQYINKQKIGPNELRAALSKKYEHMRFEEDLIVEDIEPMFYYVRPVVKSIEQVVDPSVREGDLYKIVTELPMPMLPRYYHIGKAFNNQGLRSNPKVDNFGLDLEDLCDTPQ